MGWVKSGSFHFSFPASLAAIASLSLFSDSAARHGMIRLNQHGGFPYSDFFRFIPKTPPTDFAVRSPRSQNPPGRRAPTLADRDGDPRGQLPVGLAHRRLHHRGGADVGRRCGRPTPRTPVRCLRPMRPIKGGEGDQATTGGGISRKTDMGWVTLGLRILGFVFATMLQSVSSVV